MIYAERQAWLAKARNYTRERYAAELPDKLLRSLASAPIVDEHELDHFHSLFGRGSLTPALQEVLALAALGHSDSEIAEIRCVSPYTVKSEMKTILGVLGARNRAHAVALWAARRDE